jgi:DNA-binding NarL/FixJ family response regulator
VDDHPQVRRSVREVLARSLAGGEVGEAGGRAEALARMQAESWDLVLLDLSLPDGGGLEVLRELRALRPSVPVLVMSMHSEAEYGAAARAAGAAGYLAKGSAPEALMAAVRLALDGATLAPLSVLEPEGLRKVLHDDLAQTLAALKLSLQLAQTAGDATELQRRLAESLPLVDQAIDSMRRLSARLRDAGEGSAS